MRFLKDDPALSLSLGSDVQTFARLFNDSPASRRVFPEVHYHDPEDPHLTVGMGHFIDGNLAKLFGRLRNDPDTWSFLLATWSEALDKSQWQAMARETDGPAGSEGPSALASALERVLCAGAPGPECVAQRLRPWSKGVGEAFNAPNHWFTAGWRAVSCAEPIARIQLETWRAEVLEKGADAAAVRSQTVRGGIACVISAASSGIGTMYQAGATSASIGGVHWSLVEVPDAARPKVDIDPATLLADWRAVVAWQHYTLAKNKVRSRMTAIWKMFFAASWGPAPKSVADARAAPRHSGRAMDSRPFDFRIELQPDP